MNDLIERQAAINAISCDITITGRQNAELVAATIGAFADRIKALPSAQPERKKGKWIKEDRGHVEYTGVCSECGFAWIWYDTREYFKFCPNCGAKMEGGEQK